MMEDKQCGHNACYLKPEVRGKGLEFLLRCIACNRAQDIEQYEPSGTLTLYDRSREVVYQIYKRSD